MSFVSSVVISCMSSQEEQIQQRRANLEALEKLGDRDLSPAIRSRGTRSRSWSTSTASGRTTSSRPSAPRPRPAGGFWPIRSFGKANFLVLSDGRAKIQVYIRQDSLPPLDFQIFKLLDFGDWVGVEGRLFRTKTNELTIWASRLQFLVEVPAAAAGEVARPDRRRDSLPPALPGSDRQPGRRVGCSRRAAGSSRRFASS